MNILLAINNKKIFNELKNKKNLNIIIKDIQYKEGILEILEKNKNIDYIIFNENLAGEIKIEYLIKKIKQINNKINIIIILTKKDYKKENYLIKNKINFIYNNNLNTEKILDLLCYKNKIIAILGTEGSGKTITTIIICELINKYKNKKILIIEDDIKNNSIFNIYKIEKTNNKIIKLKENIYLLNLKNILLNNKIEKEKIINEINKIKKNYDYIFIDLKKIFNKSKYEKIIDESILIMNSNLLEINKIKNYTIKEKNKLKIIFNNYNFNSISEEIIKNIFKNKIEIIGKIKNNINYNLIINNNINLKFLDYNTKKIYLNIIKKI